MTDGFPASGEVNAAALGSAAAAAATEDVPRVLARNNACHQCRKRKLRCDALRPTCTNCSKPRIRGAHAGEPPAPCTWDSVLPAGTGAGKSKQPSRPESPVRVEGQEAVMLTGNMNGNYGHKRARVDEIEDRSGAELTSLFDEIRQGDKDIAYSASRSTNAPMADFAPRLTSFDSSGSQQSSPFGSLVWSDWPQDLPSQTVVDHMVNVFFDKVPTLPKMIHRATFMSALQLPPGNSKFPARPLLHAILAISANHISESALSSRAYFPVGTPSHHMIHPERDLHELPSQTSFGFGMFASGGGPSGPAMANRSLESNFGPRGSSNSALARFQLWHRRKAYETSSAYLDKGEQLVAIVQAHVIATVIDQYNAWWVDLWMESGTCMRMSIPLALHESVDIHPQSLDLRNRKRFLAPATEVLEQAERDRTWWMVYLLDSSVAMTTVWPISMEEAEITVPLPVVQPMFDRAIGEMKGCQELNAPDLFSKHPDSHADSFNLLIKAFRLRNDVGRFFRQYSRGFHSVSKYASDPTLRTLLSRIHAFRLSCPTHLRKPTQMMNEKGVQTMDVDLISAFMITHASSISLGEPLVDSDSWTHDMARMSLAAVRAVLSLLYEITATSFDLTLFPPYVSWVWAQCVRCLCRFAEAAGKSGDSVSVSVFKAEIEVFRMALKQYGERYPTGQRHLKICDDIFYHVAFNPGSQLAVGYGCGMETVIDDGNNPWSKPEFASNKGSHTGSASSTPAHISDTARLRTSSLTSGSAGFSPNDQPSSGYNQFVVPLDGSAQAGVATEPNGQTGQAQNAFSMDGSNIPGGSGSSAFAPTMAVPDQHQNPPQQLNGPANGFTWNNSTPFAAATLLQTQQQQQNNMLFGSNFSFGNMDDSNNGLQQMPQEQQVTTDQMLDFAFDISSFSYDLDSLPNMFADSQAIFDGQDFVWKADD